MGRAAPRHQPARPLAPRHEPPAVEVTFGKGRGGRPWRRLRAQILRRDGYLCQCEDCKEGKRLLVAHEVDHIDNTRGPDGRLNDHPSNLRAINRDCHKAKTQREAARGRRR